jgi:hypothetical protein
MRRDPVFVGAAVAGSPEVMSKRLVSYIIVEENNGLNTNSANVTGCKLPITLGHEERQ